MQATDGAVLPRLTGPVAVFDAGIGSYAAVTAIQRRLPRQDVLYLADRASFPYGDKSRSALLTIIGKTLRYLAAFNPAAVLVASNAPSITVLDEVAGIIAPPVLGVRPPIVAALQVAGGGDVGVLGVASMIHSPELQAYVDAEAGVLNNRVRLVDASPLVELVEGGTFLFDAARTQDRVNVFLEALDRVYPALACLTLSSTHLPWLRSFIERAWPERPLLDPMADAVEAIVPYAVEGTGTVLTLVTEDHRFSVTDFQSMLNRLQISLPLHRVSL